MQKIKLYLVLQRTYCIALDTIGRVMLKIPAESGGFVNLARHTRRDGPSYGWHEYELLLHPHEYEYGYDHVVGVRKYLVPVFLLQNLIFSMIFRYAGKMDALVFPSWNIGTHMRYWFALVALFVIASLYELLTLLRFVNI